MIETTHARPANLYGFAQSLMGRLTPVQDSTFGRVRVSSLGLFIDDTQVAHAHQILGTARTLVEVMRHHGADFEGLRTEFTRVVGNAVLLENAGDVTAIDGGLKDLLVRGSEVVETPKGSILQDAGQILYVRETAVETSDAHLLADAMAKRNILGIEIDARHNDETLFHAMTAIFNHNELQAKAELERLGITYRYFLPSVNRHVVFVASSKGLVDELPIFIEGDATRFRLGNLVLHSPVVVRGDEETGPTYADKVTAAAAGIKRLMGGGPMLSNLELLAGGRGGEVFGLCAERNPGGAVQVDRQGPTDKISPFGFAIDEEGCVGALCGACMQVCPQDAIHMVIPEGRRAEVERLREAAGTRDPGRGPIRTYGTFARIGVGCDGCFACFAACLEAGDVVRPSGVPSGELQRLRLRLFPGPRSLTRGDK